jgi:acetyl esterase/lipase
MVLISTSVAWGGPLRQWLDRNHSESAAASESATVTLPPGTSVLHDLAYGADPRQTIDVYLPRDTHGAPELFMVHGGAWRFGDKAAAGVVQNKIDRWLPKGFIFVSVNYPMLPKLDALAQADEIAKALAFAQSQATTWGGDASKFILMGHSAGAHLVALLAAAPAKAYAVGAKPWLGTVVLDSAALDVGQIMAQRHLRFYDAAFGNDHERWQLASPIAVLRADAKPILAVCSLPRPDGSCAHAAEFVAKANALGIRGRISRQELSHEQINRELGLPSGYTNDVEAFMSSLDASVAEALAQPSSPL